jgi:hypothetical protein
LRFERLFLLINFETVLSDLVPRFRSSLAQPVFAVSWPFGVVVPARRPRLRYAPAQHALLEQALPRLAPKRVTDFVIAHILGLMPDKEKALRGVSV